MARNMSRAAILWRAEMGSKRSAHICPSTLELESRTLRSTGPGLPLLYDRAPEGQEGLLNPLPSIYIYTTNLI